MTADPSFKPMENGQRVEVQLCRGWADEWVPGSVLDAREMKVELDEPPAGHRYSEDRQRSRYLRLAPMAP